MATDQMEQLISALAKVADGMEHIGSSKYTITGAADWPILVAMGGILVVIIGFMWVDLRATIKDHRRSGRLTLTATAPRKKKT